MYLFVENRSPWESAAIRADLFRRGLWALRVSTGNYAWAGIDMALWDICGKISNLPVYKLMGGAVRSEVDYFYYLAHGDLADVRKQCMDGVSKGYTTFYLKTGVDLAHELEMLSAIRDEIGTDARLRIDSNGAWSLAEAPGFLQQCGEFNIDFAEQPVREHPMSLMTELRTKTTIPLAANEGLWSEEDANRLILNQVADIYTFSPYWVGSLGIFKATANTANIMGSQVCRHTHGELGIAASAFHQVSLTIPNLVMGNQQTAAHMDGDILVTPMPIVNGPKWGIPDGIGLCFEIDHDLLREASNRFVVEGQYLPYGKV